MCRSAAETDRPFGDGEPLVDMFGWSWPTVFKTGASRRALRGQAMRGILLQSSDDGARSVAELPEMPRRHPAELCRFAVQMLWAPGRG